MPEHAFRSSYEFFAPPRIVFGWGRRLEVGTLARGLGRRAFIIHGSRTLERSGALEELASSLWAAGVEPRPMGGISHEPTVEDVDRMSSALRAEGAKSGDLVVGVGGGSAVDLAKAACAMATNTRSPTVKEYLEGVGSGLSIEADPLPLLAMPTTAGTGSEATKNAVISSHDPPFKKSLRSERLVPRIVLVDPELSVSVPPGTTAATGMDAITQLIESYITVRSSPIPQALALQGLALAAPSIARACRHGADRDAREKMAHAALLSGMALANSGLGLAHGVAAALGVHAGVAHGLACAVMLPAAMRFNQVVKEAELARLGEVLCGSRFASPAAGAEAAINRVEGLCEEVGIPRKLSAIGVRREQLPAIVLGSRGSSMNGNPRPVADEELAALLESML